MDVAPGGQDLVIITTVQGSPLDLMILQVLSDLNNSINYIHRTSERLKRGLSNSPGCQVLIYLHSLLRGGASGEAEIREAQEKCQRALVPRCRI